MNWLKVCFLSLMIFSASAYSKDSAHIISGSSQSSVDFSKESAYHNDYDVTFALGLGYDYAFTGGLQFGGSFGTSIYSGGSSFSLIVGPGYNFNTDVENSFFTALKFGVITYHFDSYSSATDTLVTFEVGKRFKLMENVSYVPTFAVGKILGTNSPDPSFSLELFKLAIIF